MGIFYWLESSQLAMWVGGSLWGYPIALTCHSVGMAIMVGIVAMVDLRVAGCFSTLSFSGMHKALKIAWCGFVLNVISGFALFTSQASYFVTHKAFIIKIIAIVLAAINAVILQKMLKAYASHWDAGEVIPGKAKQLALSSLALWLVAVIFGRLIAYWGGY